MDNARKKVTAAWISVGSNTTLVVAKLVVGLLIGSVGVISEAIHSGVDLVASLIALFAVRAASRPPDHEHPYGHGKLENVSGTVEAVLIFGAAAWIVFEAVGKLLEPEPVESLGAGVVVMGVSATVNWWVSRYLFRVGTETDSVALQADGWHLRTDVWTSAGVMVGLSLAWAGAVLAPGLSWSWIDPAAALVVALLIVRAAWHLTHESMRDVLDTSLPDDELKLVRETISTWPHVRGLHELRTRKAGHQRFAEYHAVVDAQMTTGDSHALLKQVNQRLKELLPELSVTSHVDPCDGSCKASCLAGCLLTEAEREAVRQQVRVPE